MKNTKKANEVYEVYFFLVIVSEVLICFPGVLIIFLICIGLKFSPELSLLIWLILLPIPIIFLMVKYVKALNEPIDQEFEVKIHQTFHSEPEKKIQQTSQNAKNVIIDI